VLLVAGALKVTDPYSSATSVRAYQILPVDLANFLGFVLPFAEVAIGVFLIVGIWVRLNAIAGGVLNDYVHHRDKPGMDQGHFARLRLFRQRWPA
jgi:uncharacterized membrane protein YphA (DoxX/SURF4 family)